MKALLAIVCFVIAMVILFTTESVPMMFLAFLILLIGISPSFVIMTALALGLIFYLISLGM